MSSYPANNGTNTGSANDPIKPEPRNKTHRVRLRDDEIKLISTALYELHEKKKADHVPWQETELLRSLRRRFNTWGDTDIYDERPFYARRR